MITVGQFLEKIATLNPNGFLVTIRYQGENREQTPYEFIKSVSYLNLEGVYDFVSDDGEELTGKHGDVVVLMSGGLGRESTFYKSDGYTGKRGEVVKSFEDDARISSIRKYLENEDPNKRLLVWPFSDIDDIQILEPCLFVASYYGDQFKCGENWGAEIIRGKAFPQKYNADKMKKENTIIKFKDFNKINEQATVDGKLETMQKLASGLPSLTTSINNIISSLNIEQMLSQNELTNDDVRGIMNTITSYVSAGIPTVDENDQIVPADQAKQNEILTKINEEIKDRKEAEVNKNV